MTDHDHDSLLELPADVIERLQRMLLGADTLTPAEYPTFFSHVTLEFKRQYLVDFKAFEEAAMWTQKYLELVETYLKHDRTLCTDAAAKRAHHDVLLPALLERGLNYLTVLVPLLPKLRRHLLALQALALADTATTGEGKPS